jgi:hypothetical protein
LAEPVNIFAKLFILPIYGSIMGLILKGGFYSKKGNNHYKRWRMRCPHLVRRFNDVPSGKNMDETRFRRRI